MLSATALVRSLWKSSALRAAGALGFSGLALACGNLLLARVLPPAQFALFALFYAITQIGISLGPFGADVIMTRQHFHPNAALHHQVLKHSAIVGIALAVMSMLTYRLDIGLIVLLIISIIAGSIKVVPTSHFRSQQRFGHALLLTISTNASVLIAGIAALVVKSGTVLLPASAMTVALCLTAIIGWRVVAGTPPARPDVDAVYPMSDALLAVSFIGAGMILSSLDRLITPTLLGLPALATLSVLTTIAGSPFHMLHLGIGYTLVPALRNAPDRPARASVMRHEAWVVAAVSLVAVLVICMITPFLLHTILAGRYVISWQLLIAAICLGLAKVVGSLCAAAINALGSSTDLSRLSIAGWASIAVALAGGWIGSQAGLTGLVYGVALGWLMRALVVGMMARRTLFFAGASLASASISSDSDWE